MDPQNMNQSLTPSAPKPASSMGTIIAIVLIIAALLVGGFFFWGERDEMVSDPELNSINSQSESDATLDIEADLNSTDVDGADYDLTEENFQGS